VKIAVKHMELAVKMEDLQAVSQSTRMIANTMKGAADNFASHALMSELKGAKQKLEAAQRAVLGA